MIVDKKIYRDSDGSVGYIECVYNSSNILTTTYFPKTSNLYIAFSRGGVYEYQNIDMETYTKFETSESQGKFFLNEIKNNTKFPYQKSFKLFESEIERAKELIREWKEKSKNQEN